MASLCVSLSLFNPLPFPLRHYFIRGVNLVYVAPGFVCTVYRDLRTQKSNTIRTIVVYNLLRIQFHKTYVHKSAVSCAVTSQLAVGFKGAQKSNTFRTIAIWISNGFNFIKLVYKNMRSVVVYLQLNSQCPKVTNSSVTRWMKLRSWHSG